MEFQFFFFSIACSFFNMLKTHSRHCEMFFKIYNLGYFKFYSYILLLDVFMHNGFSKYTAYMTFLHMGVISNFGQNIYCCIMYVIFLTLFIVSIKTDSSSQDLYILFPRSSLILHNIMFSNPLYSVAIERKKLMNVRVNCTYFAHFIGFGNVHIVGSWDKF